MNEYVSPDVEMAWIDSEQDLMDLEVRVLQLIFRGAERDLAAELALWKATVPGDEQVECNPPESHDQARELIGSIGGHKVYDVNPVAAGQCGELRAEARRLERLPVDLQVWLPARGFAIVLEVFSCTRNRTIFFMRSTGSGWVCGIETDMVLIPGEVHQIAI